MTFQRPSFTENAILLRRIDYGERDLILSFLTRERGKISAIAKGGKNSVKRFGGILEPFYGLTIVCQAGRGRLPILKEAALIHPLSKIREDLEKTAYASYWTEVIDGWVQEGKPVEAVYDLLLYALEGLEGDRMPPTALSILFQMRFADLAGFCPDLVRCSGCGTEMVRIDGERLAFDIPRGAILCSGCAAGAKRAVYLCKGTIKQLLWTAAGDLNRASRLRFSPLSIKEGLGLLEAFLPYHLGRTPKSLGFLRRIRHV